MIDLVFPDGSSRQYPDGSTGRDVAAAISKSLEKKALLIKLDGQVLDLDQMEEAQELSFSDDDGKTKPGDVGMLDSNWEVEVCHGEVSLFVRADLY